MLVAKYAMPLGVESNASDCVLAIVGKYFDYINTCCRNREFEIVVVCQLGVNSNVAAVDGNRYVAGLLLFGYFKFSLDVDCVKSSD